MTQFPAWFAGKADITGGTEVVRVNDNFDLIKAEADILPGRWKVFPFTPANQASQLAAANAFVGVTPATPAGISAGNPVSGAAGAAANAVGLGGVDAIGDFFHRLTEKSTWTRFGEVALGGILVYAGVRALSSGTAVSSAGKSVTKPVKKAVKLAVPEARAVSRAPTVRVSHIYHHKTGPAKAKTP